MQSSMSGTEFLIFRRCSRHMDLSTVTKTLQLYEESLKQRKLELDIRESSLEALLLQQKTALTAEFEHREADLQRREKALEQKIELWEKSKGDLKMTLGPIVKLNVGGQFFTTSQQTLRKSENGMFSSMFSGRFELSLDESGSVFIGTLCAPKFCGPLFCW